MTTEPYYIKDLTIDDVRKLLSLCFGIEEETPQYKFRGNCLLAIPNSGTSIEFYDYMIEHRRRGFKEVNGQARDVEALYAAYMTQKFGPYYLHDYSAYLCHIKEKEQALEEAKRRQKGLINHILKTQEECLTHEQENTQSNQTASRL